MKKRHIILAAGIVIVSVLAFAAATKDQMPSADAAELWTYISQTNPYSQWSHFPGYPDIYPGKSPHGAFLQLYVNRLALDAVQNGSTMLPDGAILVKENYGKDKTTLLAITVMYKVQGFAPENADWFWAKYGPDGKDMASGKVQSCIECHSERKDNDYIFTQRK